MTYETLHHKLPLMNIIWRYRTGKLKINVRTLPVSLNSTLDAMSAGVQPVFYFIEEEDGPTTICHGEDIVYALAVLMDEAMDDPPRLRVDGRWRAGDGVGMTLPGLMETVRSIPFVGKHPEMRKAAERVAKTLAMLDCPVVVVKTRGSTYDIRDKVASLS